jgi:alkylation response protein AidB-like acyl-CoA dehydrogenase
MIQEKLALMAIKIENMRNMVLKVAWQADQNSRCEPVRHWQNCIVHVRQWK